MSETESAASAAPALTLGMCHVTAGYATSMSCTKLPRFIQSSAVIGLVLATKQSSPPRCKGESESVREIGGDSDCVELTLLLHATLLGTGRLLFPAIVHLHLDPSSALSIMSEQVIHGSECFRKRGDASLCMQVFPIAFLTITEQQLC
jgi:hypothetical protein